ncbi:unnamed protein product [Lepeophtheirus salmonis]|uniref:(salmon louse) hypothetical protein n=1 Tax=Lepeophtheirus salmonis TaxID=72036 RepID=A0A7R8CSB0_LEPSM|nr:unnamed protein product [Lepeophtheirus salmonis]CAF2913245.1 unnamed protein product [Lepeophtheirus salmonis]
MLNVLALMERRVRSDKETLDKYTIVKYPGATYVDHFVPTNGKGISVANEIVIVAEKNCNELYKNFSTEQYDFTLILNDTFVNNWLSLIKDTLVPSGIIRIMKIFFFLSVLIAVLLSFTTGTKVDVGPDEHFIPCDPNAAVDTCPADHHCGQTGPTWSCILTKDVTDD